MTASRTVKCDRIVLGDAGPEYPIVLTAYAFNEREPIASVELSPKCAVHLLTRLAEAIGRRMK